MSAFTNFIQIVSNCLGKRHSFRGNIKVTQGPLHLGIKHTFQNPGGDANVGEDDKEVELGR